MRLGALQDYMEEQDNPTYYRDRATNMGDVIVAGDKVYFLPYLWNKKDTSEVILIDLTQIDSEQFWAGYDNLGAD